MMTDNQQEMDALIVRLFNQLDEQQRIIDRLLTLLTELRAMAMGVK